MMVYGLPQTIKCDNSIGNEWLKLKTEESYKKTRRQVNIGMNVHKHKSECNIKVRCLSFKTFRKIIILLIKMHVVPNSKPKYMLLIRREVLYFYYSRPLR